MPIMTKGQRAAQLWPLLAWVATHKQTISYGDIAKLIGTPSAAIGQFLEAIQSYCLLNDLPPLTVVVVKKETGVPGDGFVGDHFERGLERVHSHHWLDQRPPTPDELGEAVRRLPSTGNRSLRPD
jgi:alkylated DNA nucleotide flippase Atl1